MAQLVTSRISPEGRAGLEAQSVMVPVYPGEMV